MDTILKGFPTEISDYIELPDIAELLSYPSFFDNSIEDVYKYGTDFHKNLLSKVPLRNNKKNISVLSEVRLIMPTYRSVTGGSSNPDHEWHIDCEENENKDGKHIYHEERDFVHLLTNECTSMTEFNKLQTVINWDHNKPVWDFLSYISENIDYLQITPQSMPANRIVTFSNHMHRATDPKCIEFKYMFRVTETDRERPPGDFHPMRPTTILRSGEQGYLLNIEKEDNKVILHLPKTLKESKIFHQSIPDYTTDYDISLDVAEAFAQYDNKEKFNKLKIDRVDWFYDVVSKNNDLYEMNPPKTSFLLLANGKFKDDKHKAFMHFIEKVDQSVKLVEIENENNYFILPASNYFYNDNNTATGPVAGACFPITNGNEDYLKKGVKYKIVFNEDNFFSYSKDEELYLIYNG